MARTVARIPCSLWVDAPFPSLASTPQWLYLVLLTQRNLSPAGIIPVTPRRWACLARDVTESQVTSALLEDLQGSSLVVVDQVTQDAFLPRWFTYEDIGTQPRRVTAAQDAILECTSRLLQVLAADELAAVVAAASGRIGPPRGVRALVLARDGYRCVACGWKPGGPVPLATNGRPLYRGLEVDHIHPKSRGGSDHPDNLQTLCTSCNASKGARLTGEA